MTVLRSIRCGFVGVGHMGLGMCRNVLSKRNKEVAKLSVFDTSASNLEALSSSSSEGPHHNLLSVCPSIPAVTAASDVIALSLPSLQAQEAVLFGPKGIVETHLSNSAGTGSKTLTILDHGTFPHDFALSAHARLATHNIRYIDAPVSGGPGGASAGTLSIMAGCTTAELDPWRPFLASYSSSIACFGSPGAGMAAKLVNQALVGVHVQAACEALALAEKMGITDMSLLAEVLANSWGQSRLQGLVFSDYLSSAKGGFASLDLPSPAPLRNLDKDFECVLMAARASSATASATHSSGSGSGSGDGATGSAALPLPLPLVVATQEAISSACRTPKRDGPFLGLIELIRKRRPL